jgi:hypothetical protein
MNISAGSTEVIKHNLDINSNYVALPITTEFISITPAIAKDYLKRNTKNRNLSKMRVIGYSNEMKAGRWKVNGDCIRFDTNGELIDGQHRLHAIIESGCTIGYIVIMGLPVDSFETIDQNKPRTTGDVLSIDKIKNSNSIGAMSTVLVNAYVNKSFVFTRNRDGGRDGTNASKQELLQFVRLNGDILQDASLFSGKKQIKALFPPSVSGSLYVILSSISKSKSKDFFEKLSTGEGLYSGDPILALRERIFNEKSKGKRITKKMTFIWIIAAWNAICRGKTLRTIRVTSASENENFDGIEKAVKSIRFK